VQRPVREHAQHERLGVIDVHVASLRSRPAYYVPGTTPKVVLFA